MKYDKIVTMITVSTLGMKNPLLPSKPLGSNHRLSTVFLPEYFPQISLNNSGDSGTKVEPDDRGNSPGDRTEKSATKISLNHPEKSRVNFWPTVVDSLSQIRPLNESIEISTEISTAIAPEIVFDRPGSNKSLVPVQDTFGELSVDREMPSSWSSLTELVENTIGDIDEEEVIFTPTGFQRQNRDLRGDRRGSTAATTPLEDTYSPSVTPPVTVTSPYFAPEPETPENLDAIVHEVYRRIIDRLQIERERNGRFYSGRLPW